MAAMRRVPAHLARTDEINNHLRVAVVGAIVSCDEGVAVIADSAGQAEVVLSQDAVSLGDVVRVIGRVYGGTIEAEIVQNLSGLNIDLYNKSLPVLQKYLEM